MEKALFPYIFKGLREFKKIKIFFGFLAHKLSL
jgi:hypothetical protein